MYSSTISIGVCLDKKTKLGIQPIKLFLSNLDYHHSGKQENSDYYSQQMQLLYSFIPRNLPQESTLQLLFIAGRLNGKR